MVPISVGQPWFLLPENAYGCFKHRKDFRRLRTASHPPLPPPLSYRLHFRIFSPAHLIKFLPPQFLIPLSNVMNLLRACNVLGTVLSATIVDKYLVLKSFTG